MPLNNVLPIENGPSERKLASCRANAAKSTGPNTPEGKARSAQNALKHGLSGATLVYMIEEIDDLEKLRNDYIERFQPIDNVEMRLTEQIVVADWRLQRCCTIETALMDVRLEEQRVDVDKKCISIDPHARVAIAFRAEANDSRALQLLNRYEARVSRQYYRAIRTLLELQKNRPDQPPRNKK